MTQPERLPYLLSQMLDGDPSEAELAELNRLLQSDASSRDSLIDHLLMDSLLSEEVGAEPLSVLVDLIDDNNNPYPVARKRSLSWIPRGQVFGMIAAILLIAFVVGLFFSGTSQASAKSWIAESRRIHKLALDRCYVVESHDTEPVSRTDPNPQRTDAESKRAIRRLRRSSPARNRKGRSFDGKMYRLRLRGASLVARGSFSYRWHLVLLK